MLKIGFMLVICWFYQVILKVCQLLCLNLYIVKFPLIISNVGGVSEIIKDNEHAIIIEPKSVESIIDSINLLLDNKILAKQISENGFELIKQNYTWDINTCKHIALYKYI